MWFKDYYLNLKTIFAANAVAKNDLDKVFKGVQQITQFQTDTFLPELELKQKKWNFSSPNETICDVVFNNLDMVKVYDEFMENLSDTFKSLDKLCDSPLVKKHLQDLNLKVGFCCFWCWPNLNLIN